MAITQATQLADFTSGIGTAGAILEVDNVSNKIGIGTTNPQALLQVGQIIKMDGPSGIITATTFSGNFTGNITGNATGLSGTPNITVNNIIGVGATFTGQVTYEDVTNIDSIGIITARSNVVIADKIIHLGDTNTAIRFPSADTFTVETSGVERLRVGSTGTVGVAGLSTATSFGAFNHLSAPFGGGTVSYTVTVASKTADHRYNGSGSGNAYLIDGVQSPFLTLTPGRTYRFVHDNTGSHPLKFYLEADKTTLYSTGVTFDNAYTEIVVSDSTPQVLHYQCTNHSLMGNAVQTNSNIGGGFNVVDESSDTTCFPLFATAATGTALAAKSGTNLTFNSSSGALTATSFVGALTGAVTGNADTATTSTNVTVADESSDTTCFPLFATAATGNLPPKSGTNLTFNSSTGALTATSFVGALTGNVTGNADTATNASGLTGTPNISCGTGAFSGNVTLQANLDLQDNDKILLGTGDDFEIFHDGSNSIINDGGTGNLQLQAAGTTRVEVTTSGINVTGEVVASGQGQFKGAEGASAYLYLYADEGDDNADKFRLQVADGGPFTIQNFTSGGWETNIECNGNAAVELYYDNSKKLETSSAGVTVTGTLNATTAVTQDGKGLATTGKAIAMAMIFG